MASKTPENNTIVIFENGSSLVLEGDAEDILNDIKRQYKNIKVYKANEVTNKMASEKAQMPSPSKTPKKMITIFFQSGIELDLEDPTDEMIAEIIEKFDNTIIIEKPNVELSADLDLPVVPFVVNSREAECRCIPLLPLKSSLGNGKKIIKEDVRKALMNPGTPINGQILSPIVLFALLNTLRE